MPYLDQFFNLLIKEGASDLHIGEGQPPKIRRHGDVMPIRTEPITREEATVMMSEICGPKNWELFEERGDLDFAYEMDEASRFRCNYLKQTNGYGAVFRLIPTKIASLEDLGIPSVVKEFGHLRGGLVLVTGPTGSGKSTTLAGMVDAINRRECDHIITMEDPIEYAFISAKSCIEQREVGSDVPTFASGLRHALRQDPDVILVGEMRDLETTGAAITAAETGHLVFSTLHTVNAPQTIERIIDIYPSDQQNQIRSMLANTLQAVISQTLFKRADQPGMIPGVEIMLCTPAVRNCIRENRIFEIPNILETSRALGMQTLDSSIKQLFVNGYISREDAIAQAAHPEKLERSLAA